jgi:hypothetical protein
MSLKSRSVLRCDLKAAYAYFERTVEQLKNEHDARIADLRSGPAVRVGNVLCARPELASFSWACFVG